MSCRVGALQVVRSRPTGRRRTGRCSSEYCPAHNGPATCEQASGTAPRLDSPGRHGGALVRRCVPRPASSTGVPAVDGERNTCYHGAASLSRNTIGPAISSSVAQRPSGICSRNGRATSRLAPMPEEIGVMTTVGLTLLTRMLYLPSSSAERG